MKLGEASLDFAEQVGAACAERGYELLLIGGMALAAHGYPRHTVDIDFAIAIDPRELENLASALTALGFEVEVSPADADDPLGGVLTVRRAGAAPIQIVNYDNSPAGGFPRLVRDSLQRASSPSGGIGKLPSVEDLVLFKLCAGGPKSQLDVLELFTRTKVDLDTLRDRAAAYRMSEALGQVLRLAGIEDSP